MSIHIQHKNDRIQNDSKAVLEKKDPPESHVTDFQKFMGGQRVPLQWQNWPGFKPEFKEFEHRAEVVETEDTVEATISEDSVPEEKKGAFEEFVSWFKNGVENLAKSLGKGFAMMRAEMMAQSVFSSL
jgi:hypothetical protein